MHSRMGMMAHTPSFAVTLAGHGVAWVIFLLTFPALSVRPVWIPQFSVLLAIATALLLAVPLLWKRTYRLAALLAAVLVDVVLGIPQGPDLALEAVLGTVFIFVVMTDVEGGLAYFLCVGCALALSWSHWPITAWGIRVAGAAPISSALLGAYFLFLTWLAGWWEAAGRRSVTRTRSWRGSTERCGRFRKRTSISRSSPPGCSGRPRRRNAGGLPGRSTTSSGTRSRTSR